MPPCRICANVGMRVTSRASGQAAQRISKMVGGLILLKETLQVLPALAEQLEAADSQLLQAIGANCGHEVFRGILNKTTQLLDEVLCPVFIWVEYRTDASVQKWQ